MTLAGEAHRAMRALPVATFDDILGGDRALILAPHPDDETIGCGGLIAEAVARQAPPIVMFVTDGSGSHPASLRYPPCALIRLRQSEAFGAAAVLGLSAERLHFMALRDTACPDRGPEFDAAVNAIVQIIAGCKPCVVIAPWRHDPHCDHVAVHEMAAAAAAAAGVRHLSYPVWGWTLADRQFLGAVKISGWRLDTRKVRSLKLRALAAHASQMTDLIDDDPAGFCLTAGTLARIMPGYETYLDNP